MATQQVQEERFVFETEWFDAQADLIRKYLLTFYPGDNTIDMVSLYSPTDRTCTNLDRQCSGFNHLVKLYN